MGGMEMLSIRLLKDVTTIYFTLLLIDSNVLLFHTLYSHHCMHGY